MGICSILKWFTIQMPGTMEVQFSDHHLVNRLVLRPPFLYSDARYHGTVHLNNEQVKVCYSDPHWTQLNLCPFLFSVTFTKESSQPKLPINSFHPPLSLPIFLPEIKAVDIQLWWPGSYRRSVIILITCDRWIESCLGRLYPL